MTPTERTGLLELWRGSSAEYRGILLGDWLKKGGAYLRLARELLLAWAKEV